MLYLSREFFRALMTLFDCFLFLYFVALETYAQTMTGFAFGLLLLGLTGRFDLAPLPLVSNMVSILTLVNLSVTIWRSRPPAWTGTCLCRYFPVRRLASPCSVWAPQWMSADLAVMLHWLLGFTIVLCAFMLISDARRRTEVSERGSFALVGALSGFLGGLFASGGAHRLSPISAASGAINGAQHLAGVSAFSSETWLLMVSVSGALDRPTVVLSLTALPVAIVLTWLVRRYANMDAMRLVWKLVFLLVLAAELGWLLTATMALLCTAGNALA